ncbi:hypothetical protein PanWU01x14_194990, partial [Parasponia andersonii]
MGNDNEDEYPVSSRETSDTRGQVNDKATRVINDPQLRKPALGAPHTKRTDSIGQRNPEGHEQHPRLEAHPSQQGPTNEDHRQGREHELEIHHARVRYPAQEGLFKEEPLA